MRVLGIETSCDETAAAVYDGDAGLMSHVLFSQADLHAAYGGVVPEIASRDHVRRLLPLIRQALDESGTPRGGINGIAYTAGPGLIGALLVGATLGRSLAWAWGVPAAAIHHMEGHLLTPMLEPDAPGFPFVALLVSGGHTQLVAVEGLGRYRMLGDTLDDAAGEAFDKTAKLLGLPYPGGPALAALAREGQPGRYHFPRPMTDRPGLDLSFSGLKTAVVHALREAADDRPTRAAVAHAFEKAVVETLAVKCRRALEATGVRRLVVAGGVGANARLRERISTLVGELGATVHYPRPEFCTDNAAMIAYAGWCRLSAGESAPLAVEATARWALETLRPPGAPINAT